MIGRAGAHLDRGLMVIAAQGVHSLGGDSGDWTEDPFRAARSARGVHHLIAERRIVDIRPVLAGYGVVIALKAVDRPTDR